MATFGALVSKEGKSVTSNEPRDFVFSSDYPTLKIYSHSPGTVTIPSGVTTADVTISHSLGFAPLYMVYSQLNDGSGKWFLNKTLIEGDADTGTQYVSDIRVTSANLYIRYGTLNTSSSHDIDYFYYIFGNKGGA